MMYMYVDQTQMYKHITQISHKSQHSPMAVNTELPASDFYQDAPPDLHVHH